MVFTNASIFRPDGSFRRGSFAVEDGRVARIWDGTAEQADVDLNGKCVIPGLVDIHTHGNSGYDFSDGEGLETMMRWYAANGVTSVTPASMTLPVEKLERAYEKASAFAGRRPKGCARLIGINMEGPFFSYGKRGAQNPDYLRKPDYETVLRLQKAAGGLLKIVCVAPELEGALDFIEKAAGEYTVSIAHTEADYDVAREAIARGASHMTHLFNGMPGIRHRDPGPIGAASENEAVYAELICDGRHVSPSAVRMAYKLFPGRVCIISDSLACCGLPDGRYESGGLPVTLKDDLCRLDDGTIAGSVCNAYSGMRNCVKFGISREEAILSATVNPARQAKCADRVGSIEPGKLADFVVCEEDLTRIAVYIGGIKL